MHLSSTSIRACLLCSCCLGSRPSWPSRRPSATHARDPKVGRYRSKQDLAQELIADALGTEWGRTDEEREARSPPWWTHTRGLVPCDCKTCFHCKAQLTYGIAHPALSPEQQQQAAAQKRIRTSEGNSAVKKPRLDHAYVVVSGKAQHCEVCRDHWAQRRQAGQTEAWIRGGCNYSKKGCVPAANASASNAGRPGTTGRSVLADPSGSSRPKSRS